MRERPTPDRFHVGQRCLLVLKDDPAFALYDGIACVVTHPRRQGSWSCTDPGTGDEVRLPGLRYGIRVRLRTFFVEEDMLRPFGARLGRRASAKGEAHSTVDVGELRRRHRYRSAA